MCKMMRAHVIYPSRPGARSAPWSIGNAIVRACLARGWRVSWQDWDDTASPTDADVTIGHPHPTRGPFANARGPRVAIFPVAMPRDLPAPMRDAIDASDSVVAISGPRWASHLPPSWRRVDMAVDREHWAPGEYDPASRRWLYVGCTLAPKGTDLLAQVSTLLPPETIYHVGPGVVGGRVVELGVMPDGEWRRIARDFRGVVSTGSYDACPTFVLEGASMGMIAACTYGAGWGDDIAVALPSDAWGIAERLAELGALPHAEQADARARAARAAMAYTYERMMGVVMRCAIRAARATIDLEYTCPQEWMR